VSLEVFAIRRGHHQHVAFADSVHPRQHQVRWLCRYQASAAGLVIHERIVNAGYANGRGGRGEIDAERMQEGPGRCRRHDGGGPFRSNLREVRTQDDVQS
jgi:hypothetical protein